eukprot:5836770-Amphidinium_carterae.1
MERPTHSPLTSSHQNSAPIELHWGDWLLRLLQQCLEFGGHVEKDERNLTKSQDAHLRFGKANCGLLQTGATPPHSKAASVEPAILCLIEMKGSFSPILAIFTRLDLCPVSVAWVEALLNKLSSRETHIFLSYMELLLCGRAFFL